MKKIYDNTNLAESYAGAVTPLTASFARDLYEGVYRHFTAFMGVSSADRRAHEYMFPQMIVTIGYHLFYDIRNWYTLVSLLPGYAYNRPFFEQMLGIPPSAITLNKKQDGAFARGLSRVRLLWQILKILGVFLIMPILVKRFNKRFDDTFSGFMAMDLSKMSYEELCAHYQKVRHDLVRLWRVPIANDFAVMVSTGVARTLYRKWALDDQFITHLTRSSRAGLATLDPGRNLIKIRDVISANTELHSLLESDASPKEVLRRLKDGHSKSGIASMIDEYITKYGSRVPNELKLEAPTLIERPENIIGMLRALSSSGGDLFKERITRADMRVNELTPVSGWVRRSVLSAILTWACASIRYREETRLRRTQIFGHARQVFLTIGNVLAKDRVIAEPSDVMFLTAEEMCSIRGKVSWVEIVAKRKKEMMEWKETPMPTRIESEESLSAIEMGIKAQSTKNAQKILSGKISGMVASRAGASSISGKALVMREFNQNADFLDRILVTRHTDPGWTVVFPLVRAIVVERGGVLSHASIVAREMDIPCVIGVNNATKSIPDDANITIDLVSGTISIDTLQPV